MHNLTENEQAIIVGCAKAAERLMAFADTSELAGEPEDVAFCLYNAEAEACCAFFFAGVRNDWARQTFLPLTRAA